jgi:hypothetical protein
MRGFLSAIGISRLASVDSFRFEHTDAPLPYHVVAKNELRLRAPLCLQHPKSIIAKIEINSDLINPYTLPRKACKGGTAASQVA